MERLDFETIDIHNEKAKELAQILTNDKAIAILHLLEDRELSISEISKELDLPISTVSYHVDRMRRVGLVEVVGKKYGKRLQEVKLYRASNRPILLIPRRSVSKVEKRPIVSIKRLHVISLGLAGLVAAGVYSIAAHILSPAKTAGPNETIQAVSKRLFASSANTTTSQTGTTAGAANGWLMSHTTGLSLGLAGLAFVITFLLVVYLLKRRDEERFLSF
ncbi:ArsR/SmtB family transcription factor [Thermococcus sp.]